MSNAAQQYHDLICDRIRVALLGFTPEMCADTYALAMLFHTVQVPSGQVLQSAIEFTYNTYTHLDHAGSPEYAAAEQAYLVKMQKVADMKANRAPMEPKVYVDPKDPLRPGMVKWTYTYWCHDVRANVPRIDKNGFADPLDLAIRDAWCREQGIAQTGLDWTDRPKYSAQPLALATLGMCGWVIQSLHDSGLIRKRFSRHLPIFIQEIGSESGGEGDVLATVLTSNPPEATAEYLWHREEVREYHLAMRPPPTARTLSFEGHDDDLLPDGSNPVEALKAITSIRSDFSRNGQDYGVTRY